MTSFTRNVLLILQNIPNGCVMTYGQVARVAGSPRAARQVVRVLHSMSKNYHLPWHRVVNAKGQIVIKDEASYNEQLLNLEAEGVEVGEHDRIDLGEYQWNPTAEQIKTILEAKEL
jgi:methylated-DNA-protein-cysteine methyltransferase related protein